MIKINATIRALSPVFVGSDVTGNIRLPYMIHIPGEKDKKKIDKEKIEKFVQCLGAFYRNAEKESFGKRSFSEIFRDRVYVSLCCNTISEFFTNLKNKLNLVESTFYQYIVLFIAGLSDIENKLLLSWGRTNIDLFATAAVYFVDSWNFKNEFVIDDSLCYSEIDNLIPVIPGNSIRGRMRDLLMEYIIQKVYSDNPHKCLTAKQYHTLFSGGMLNQESGFVNVESKRQFREILPFLSIIGCMKGNEDLPGKINVNFAKVKCFEYDPKYTRSAYSYLKQYFQIRTDDYEGAVSEAEIKELGSSVQMIYAMLCIETGTEFEWLIEYSEYLSEIEKQFFDLMLHLFIDNRKVGGMARCGYGNIEIIMDYKLDYSKVDGWLIENKEKIKKAITEI